MPGRQVSWRPRAPSVAIRLDASRPGPQGTDAAVIPGHQGRRAVECDSVPPSHRPAWSPGLMVFELPRCLHRTDRLDASLGWSPGTSVLTWHRPPRSLISIDSQAPWHLHRNDHLGPSRPQAPGDRNHQVGARAMASSLTGRQGARWTYFPARPRCQALAGPREARVHPLYRRLGLLADLATVAPGHRWPQGRRAMLASRPAWSLGEPVIEGHQRPCSLGDRGTLHPRLPCFPVHLGPATGLIPGHRFHQDVGIPSPYRPRGDGRTLGPWYPAAEARPAGPVALVAGDLGIPPGWGPIPNWRGADLGARRSRRLTGHGRWPASIQRRLGTLVPSTPGTPSQHGPDPPPTP